MSTPLLNHRYRILKALAEGGFGKTFLVEDTQMPSRRQCVIKQLKPMNDRPEVFQVIQERFSREAAVLEAVGKGNTQIPDLYAYFQEGGQFYLVQEWIEGSPLIALVHEDWSDDRVRSLLTSALTALTHVHQQNIIHRDIKPDNIILRKVDNLPCLIDFGAVKEVMSTVVRRSGATQSSLVIGTPGFMPPEQAAGRPTFSSDLYSLSMTMIFLLTKRSPAQLPTDSQTGEILWRQFAPEVGNHLATVLTRSIHPYTQNRYATATEMLAALPPNTLEQEPTEASFPPAIASVGSGVPTLAPDNLATPAIASPSKAAVFAKLSSPWMRVGLAAGLLLFCAGVVNGVRPKSSSNGQPTQEIIEDFPARIESLETTIESEPDNTVAQADLADAYWEVGDYDEAIAQAEAVLVKDSNNTAAMVTKGKTQAVRGEYKDAIATFTQAAEANPKDATAIAQRGNAYYEIGEYDKAVEDYRSALRIDPNNGAPYKDWSAVNMVWGNPQEALQNLNLAIDNNAATISAHVNRGSRQADLGNRIKAIADWTRASAMPAYTASEYASRGYAKSRMGNKEGALDDYNQALIINPNHVDAMLNRTLLFYETGERQQALNLLEKVLAINPNSVLALLLKGELNAYANPADWESAIAAYTKALDTNPNDPGVLNNRCSAYYAIRELEKALADCDRGLQIDPRSTAIYIARGNIRMTQENFDGAIKDASRALELLAEAGGNPNREATAYSNRASALVQIQDFNGALSDIDKALALKPEDAANYYQRGLIKAALKDTAGAGEDMRKAADIYVKEGRTENHQNVLAMMEQLGL